MALCGHHAAAQEQLWTAGKPIRVIVPWAAGGVADATARAMANAMTIRLKHPFIVENKPGATGMIGAAYVATSSPDGYTLLLGNVETHVMDPLLFPKTIRYDPEKSFDSIMEMVRVPMALVARGDIPVQGPHDLVRLAKAAPGKYSYGTWGVGSTAHLAFLLLEQQRGIEMNHVPYNGAPPTYVALRGGHIDFILAQVPWAVDATTDGKARVLGITSATRTTLAPSVPTLAEAGLEDYVFESWMGLYAPRGTPAKFREAMSKELTAWLQTPAARTELAPAGAEPSIGDATQLLKRQTKELEFWRRIVKARSISIE
ncbi:tripartite tricarboxylate transporter substrate binding protein [Variovorax paradoxus]|uniref:tripartite tricarboxylate transporter substrate binding protein n=1 Tax=Variovorax paradoxus TaxID=34073 RepID=UPI00193410EA|nr:tripartite tricarboxylate transporter substrate binding protein [Variovorax paradoxus]